MNLSIIPAFVVLAILLFLLAAGWLAWFAVSPTLLGVIALVTAILLLVEGGPHRTTRP